jgi:ubiquinone biosynthesis protein
VLVLAWVARRLLGARRVSVLHTLLAGVTGYALGIGLAWAMALDIDDPVFGLTAAALAVVFVMIALVGLELFAERSPGVVAPRAPGIPRPFRAIRMRFSVARRFLVVTRIVMRHGLGGVLGLDRRAGSRGAVPGGLAQRARRTLEDAGGMFVKLGQLLSTRVDLIPLSAARELARLQERAAPADPHEVRKVVEAELGCPVEEVFAEFDWEPLAAASLGQVHAARLATGEQVAVKVQRPGIAEVVERDLAIVRRLARVVEARTDWGPAYGVVAIAEEFAARLREELDYGREATNAAEVASALKEVPQIHVHDVWEELSTSRLLVMERLDGVSVGALVEDDGRREERAKLADALLAAELEPMLAGERFHADPHPGNVFLLGDGRLGLLDFGATGRLDAFERSSIASMLTAIRDGDPTLLREATLEVAEVRGQVDVYRLDRTLAQFMARHISGGATPDAAALSELLNVFGAHGIALPPTTTTMFRALVTLEGTLNALVPGYRVVEAAEQLGKRLTDEALSPASFSETAREELIKLAPLLQRAPRHLDRIATLVERGELRTRVSFLSDQQDVRVVSRLVNRAVLAVTGSTLGIVSAILLGLDGGPALAPHLTLLQLLGYVGLASGAILILRVVLAALRED